MRKVLALLSSISLLPLSSATVFCGIGTLKQNPPAPPTATTLDKVVAILANGIDGSNLTESSTVDEVNQLLKAYVGNICDLIQVIDGQVQLAQGENSVSVELQVTEFRKVDRRNIDVTIKNVQADFNSLPDEAKVDQVYNKLVNKKLTSLTTSSDENEILTIIKLIGQLSDDELSLVSIATSLPLIENSTSLSLKIGINAVEEDLDLVTDPVWVVTKPDTSDQEKIDIIVNKLSGKIVSGLNTISNEDQVLTGIKYAGGLTFAEVALIQITTELPLLLDSTSIEIVVKLNNLTQPITVDTNPITAPPNIIEDQQKVDKLVAKLNKVTLLGLEVSSEESDIKASIKNATNINDVDLGHISIVTTLPLEIDSTEIEVLVTINSANQIVKVKTDPVTTISLEHAATIIENIMNFDAKELNISKVSTRSEFVNALQSAVDAIKVFGKTIQISITEQEFQKISIGGNVRVAIILALKNDRSKTLPSNITIHNVV